MKIKNIAFFGVMASILTVAGANATIATNVTKIASQQYVDAKDAATLSSANTYTDGKIDALDGGFTAQDGKPITTITEENGVVSASTGTITTDAFDSTTLKTTVDATGSNTALVTEKAVRDAITTAVSGVNSTVEGLDLNEVSDTGKAVVAVSQANGQVAAQTGTIDVEHGIASDAKAISTNVDISATGGSDTKLVTEGGLKKVVTDLDYTGVSNTGENAGKAVVAVSQADGVITASMGEITTAGIASTALAGTSIADADNASSTKLATEAAVRNAVDTALQSATSTVNGLDLDQVGGGASGDSVIVAVSQADGRVAAEASQVTNAMVANTAAIDYSKMNNALKNVNTDQTETCSADDPCMLVNIGNGEFKWSKIAYAEPTPVANTPVTPGSGE